MLKEERKPAMVVSASVVDETAQSLGNRTSSDAKLSPESWLPNEMEALLDGIAEVSKHARNILFALISLVVFVLLAAAADREVSLDRQSAEVQYGDLSVKAEAAGREFNELEKKKTAADAEVTQLSEHVKAREQDIRELSERSEKAEASLRAEQQEWPATHSYQSVYDRELAHLRVLQEDESLAKTKAQWPAYAAEFESLKEASERYERASLVRDMLASKDAKTPGDLEKLDAARVEERWAKAALDATAAQEPILWEQIQRARREQREATRRVQEQERTQWRAAEQLRRAQETLDALKPLLARLDAIEEARPDAYSSLYFGRERLKLATEARDSVAKEVRRAQERAERLTQAEASAKSELARLARTDNSVSLPVIGVRIRPTLFFLVGPWLVFFVSLYLRIYVRELGRRAQWFDDAANQKGWSVEDRAQTIYPWLMNFARYDVAIARLIGGVALDWLAPLTLIALLTIYERSHAPNWPVSLSMSVSLLLSLGISVRAALRTRSWTSLAKHVATGGATPP